MLAGGLLLGTWPVLGAVLGPGKTTVDRGK